MVSIRGHNERGEIVHVPCWIIEYLNICVGLRRGTEQAFKKNCQKSVQHDDAKPPLSKNAYLNLGFPKEANGSFIGSSPEVLSSKVERIEELNNGVQFSGQSLKVSFGLCGHGGLGQTRTIGGGWSEGGGRTSQEGGKKQLHCQLLYYWIL